MPYPSSLIHPSPSLYPGERPDAPPSSTLIGQPSPGGGAVVLRANRAYAMLAAGPLDDTCFAALDIYVDGLGPGDGAGLLRGVLYTEEGIVVATTQELVVSAGESATWHTLRPEQAFEAALLEGGEAWWLALWVGGTDQAVRVFVRDPLPPGSRWVPAPYGGSTPDLSIDATELTHDLSIVASVFPPYVPPTNVDDDYLATLPWGVAQAALGGGTVTQTRLPATLGWHGTEFDDRLGAFAIARTGSAAADLVGERIKITQRRGALATSIVVVLTDELDFPDETVDEDLSVPRDVFTHLAPATTETLPTVVEVVG